MFWLICCVGVFILVLLIVLACWLIKPIQIAKEHEKRVDTEEENTYYDFKTESRKYFPKITDKPSIYVSFIVPAYNEEKRIPIMLDEAIEYCINRNKTDKLFTWEIIVVDDGSVDGTYEIVLNNYCKKYNENIFICKLSKNRGKGGAVRMGMMRSRGYMRLMVDADGATKFNNFEYLENKLLEINNLRKENVKKLEDMNNLEGMICGSRSENEKVDRSIIRKLLMNGFHLIVEMLLNEDKIKDTQCGFKLFGYNTVQNIFIDLHIERWSFDIELLILCKKLKIDVEEVSVNWHEVDGSKISIIESSISMLRELMIIKSCYSLGIWKVKNE